MNQSDAIPRPAEPIEPSCNPISAFARKFLLRLSIVLVITFVVSFALNSSAARLARNGPPGFSAGLVHGALMPAALPALLLGKNVMVYAAPNEGRVYNIGYTLGVNASGACFFGLLYWRLNRWRKRYGGT
jgi:hypothetical protein